MWWIYGGTIDILLIKYGFSSTKSPEILCPAILQQHLVVKYFTMSLSCPFLSFSSWFFYQSNILISFIGYRIVALWFRGVTLGCETNQPQNYSPTPSQMHAWSRSFLSLNGIRTGGVQRNQIHISTLQTLGIQKMYMGTLGYIILILH